MGTINPSKQLYDKDHYAFNPITDAIYVHSGVIISTNSVKEDIDAINNSLVNLSKIATGADQIQGSLDIEIEYTTTNSSSSPENTPGITWSSDMIAPSPGAPYAWKRTEYFWETIINNNPIRTSIKVTYEIISTALFPETQIMFAHVKSTDIPTGESLYGPNRYGDNIQDLNPNIGSNVLWYTYLQSLDGVYTDGYMAVRHRDAGSEFPTTGSKKDWNIGLFARFTNTNSNT